MDEPIFKFEELKRHKRSFFFKSMSFIEENYWPKKIFLFLLFPIWLLLLPFLAWKANYLLWGFKVRKMVRKKMYSEAFLFGFDRLTTWAKDESELRSKGNWPPFQNVWWMTFSSICDCALKMDDPQTLEKLEKIIDKRPEKNGYMASDCFCAMARVAWTKGDREKSWDWINEAVSNDGTYGYSHYLRAWEGFQLGKGQPVSDLVLAIKNQPELQKEIFEDELFIKDTALLESLNKELHKNTLESSK